MIATRHGRVVSWVGGWTPRHGTSVGIVLVADSLGAGLALLAAVLVIAAVVYSSRFYEDAEAHLYVLLLLFLAGMTGFVLSGDLFTMALLRHAPINDLKQRWRAFSARNLGRLAGRSSKWRGVPDPRSLPK